MPFELERIENWDEKSAALKERYFGLSDQDLQYTRGEEEDLINRLHVATGKKREELIRELKRL